MSHLIGNIYWLFVTLPDHFYPFANEINGRRIRGMRSYQKAVARALKKNGAGRMGYKLTLYRQTFHFAGSIIFIVLATFLAKNFFGSEVALYFLLYTAIVALNFQEFYLHPKRYGQHLKKGVIDWSFWVLPILFYIYV